MKAPVWRSLRLAMLLSALLLLTHGVSARGPSVQEAPPPKLASEPSSPQTGFVPPPVDLSHLADRSAPVKLAAALPSSWDWRDQGKVTPVRNQGSCGSCYSFGALGNIESRLLVDGDGEFDFSENNAKECNWYEVSGTGGGTSCDGGNYSTVANLFTKQGLVLESCDPYTDSDVACSAGCTYEKTLLDWRIISGSSIPSADLLKQYIYEYGAIYTTMYAGNGDAWRTEFGSYDGSYTLYHPGGETPNHAVLIVGWDENLTHDGGSGGWIVKNSWGTWWGDDGYFTIAYGSASMGKYSSFAYAWQDYDDDGEVFYYDEGGWSSNRGCGDPTAWGLAQFTPTSDGTVTRVEFWTTDATTDVDVYVYDDFDGTTPSNLLSQQLNSSFDEPGYHSVALDSPVSISSGDDVVAVVKITTAGHGYPIAADQYGPAETGLTYISCSGGDGSWTDLGSYAQDVAIRLRTGAAGSGCGDPREPNDSQPEATSISYGETVTDPDVCSAGDEDYYAFSGSAGDIVAADVDAGSLSPVSDLDATLSLLDASGSEIAYSDDHDGVDPHVDATLPADGTYYLRLREHSHPSEGGAGYFYTLSLTQCHWADLDCDCSVSVADLQALANAWRCTSGEDDCYDARLDADGDGVITVLDIAGAAASWGASCP